MNIAFVNSTRKWGGVKSWTLDVAQGLSSRGHNILVAGRPGAFIKKAASMGLETMGLSFGPDFNPLSIFGFIKLFKTRKVDLVVVNVGKDMRTAGIAAKVLNIPVIHRVGLAGDMLNTYKVRWLHKWIRPRILVPCEQIKTGLLQELPYLTPTEVTVILTGKESAPFPPTTTHSPMRFISTSQLNADKGHKDVLKAFSDLKKRGYDFEYHIVGTGRIEKDLKQLANALDLNDRVVWHGFQTEVRPYLQNTDVFILSSYREGLPNTLLEAMSEGLVCLARDVGGVKEIWPLDNSCCLPNIASSEDFSTAIEALLTMTQSDLISLSNLFWESTPSRNAMILDMESYFYNEANNK